MANLTFKCLIVSHDVDNTFALWRITADIATTTRPRSRETVLGDDSGPISKTQRCVRVFGAEAERLEVRRCLCNPVHVIYFIGSKSSALQTFFMVYITQTPLPKNKNKN